MNEPFDYYFIYKHTETHTYMYTIYTVVYIYRYKPHGDMKKGFGV